MLLFEEETRFNLIKSITGEYHYNHSLTTGPSLAFSPIFRSGSNRIEFWHIETTLSFGPESKVWATKKLVHDIRRYLKNEIKEDENEQHRYTRTLGMG